METVVQIDNILKRNQLSVTDSRRKILELFRENNKALAHSDIEKKAGEKFDRVTVYRTLQTFVEKGILHTIPTQDNSVLYALCKDECTTGHHQDNHVHFICDKCNITYCLQGVNHPTVMLPANFRVTEVNVVVRGICNTC